jgi:hypothetical protein
MEHIMTRLFPMAWSGLLALAGAATWLLAESDALSGAYSAALFLH